MVNWRSAAGIGRAAVNRPSTRKPRAPPSQIAQKRHDPGALVPGAPHPSVPIINAKPSSLMLSTTSTADTASPSPRSSAWKPKTASNGLPSSPPATSAITATARKFSAPLPIAICSASSPDTKTATPLASAVPTSLAPDMHQTFAGSFALRHCCPLPLTLRLNATR